MTVLSPVAPVSTAVEPGEEPASLVSAAIDLFRVHEFHRVSLELLAATTGRGIDEVRESFATVDDLVFAVVRAWNGERLGPLLPIAERHGAVAFLRAVVQANIADPGLMRTLSATVNIVATGTSPIAMLLQDEWMRFHVLVQRALMRDIEAGREPATMEPARGAEQLIALYEGLQLQAMVRPAMNLLDAYDRATHRLRDGWARAYEAPVWEI